MTPVPANDNQSRPQWFDGLLKQYDPAIRAACSGRSASFDDLYQDVVCTALMKWQQYRPEGNFVSWIRYLVRDAARKHAKDSAERPTSGGDRPVNPEQECAVDLSIIARSADRYFGAAVLMAAGYTSAEAGRILGRSKNIVLTDAARARDLLRREAA